MKVAAIRLSPTGSRWLTFSQAIPLEAVGPIVRRKLRRAPRDWNKFVEAGNAARRAMSTVPHEEDQALADEYATSDVTLQELADRYGLSRERIRQIIVEVDPTASQRRKERRRREQAEQEAAEAWGAFKRRCRRALTQNLRCKACGCWIIRASKTTCSPECAAVYPILRIFDDPDYHRRAMAKVYLAKPDKYSDVQLEWARRMLGPNPPRRNRTFLVPGSERAEIIKKYRPERYAELVSA